MKNIKLLLFSVPVLLLWASCSETKSGDIDKTPDPFIANIITEFEENKAVAGYPVTLTGLNFSPVASENKIVYGVGLDAKYIEVNESSEERIVFNAPTVDKNPLNIRVSTSGKESNSVSLAFTNKPGEWSDEPTIDLPGAKTVTIVPGVEWTSFHGMWEGQIRNINIVRTTLNEHNSLGMYYNYSDQNLMDLDEKCIYLDAIAGTNGPMACCHFARVDGEIKRLAIDADPWFNCALTIDDNNVVNIVKVTDNYAAKRLPNKTVGCAGPLLIWEGVIQTYKEDKTEDFFKVTHPRTAIGLSSDCKTVIQVAVDGRYTSSETDKRAIGMSTALLSKLMIGLGCYKAMNFDGGGGTAMWVYGQGDKGIVNHPCDLANWDTPWESLRATGNAVYIKSDLKK